MKRRIFIGWEPREKEAFEVFQASILRRLSQPVTVSCLVLQKLIDDCLYVRPIERRGDKIFDLISATDSYDGSCATEFAISRFFVPMLAGTGAAMFADCDMLARCDVNEVFDIAEKSFAEGAAIACVKHPNYVPSSDIKMDGQLQTFYARKNWSSVVVFNCDSPFNKGPLEAIVNKLPGRDLHGFCWVPDELIAELPATYNHLVGVHTYDSTAKIIHWTNGGPWFEKFVNEPFADDWRQERSYQCV